MPPARQETTINIFCNWFWDNWFAFQKQYFALMYKNFLLFLRNWKITCFTLTLPSLLILTLYALIVGIAVNMALPKFNSELHPTITNYPKIERCRGFGGRTCKTIGFAPSENTFVKDVISRILTKNELSSDDAMPFPDYPALFAHLRNQPNTTLLAVYFTNTTGDNIAYTIMHNSTANNDPTDPFNVLDLHPDYTTSLQMSIDNAILDIKMAKTRSGQAVQQEETSSTITATTMTTTNPVNHHQEGFLASKYNSFKQEAKDWIGVKLKQYPMHFDNQTTINLDIFSEQIETIVFLMFGSYFLQMAFVATWVVVLYYVSYEKENMLRFGLTMMGVDNLVYWLSWISTGLLLVFISVIISIVTGLVLGMPFFTQANFFVLVIVFMSFGFSLVSMCLVIASIISTVKAAIIIAFAINGIAFFFGSFTSSVLFVYILYFLLSDFVLIFLHLFPPFSFTKCLGDIAIKVYFFKSPYTWFDFFKSIKSFNQSIGLLFAGVTIPTGFMSCIHMLISSGIYLFIAWYLDNVLPSKMGATRKPWFFLQPSYWGLSYRSSEQINAMLANYQKDIEKVKDAERNASAGGDPEVLKEIEKAVDAPSRLRVDERELVRIIQLEKTYSSLFTGNVQALKGVSITAKTGTCLAILGHNGAGKTTLISTLIGLTNPTRGSALIFGLDIDYDISAIRSQIGVCPQHDILWDQLTAWETLRLFAMIKHVPVREQSQVITDLLKDVNLYDVRNKKTSEFSGGMKRRLSVAISMIGAPKLVFLDEPTTGLDPKSRRNIWSLIYRMKKDKLVILTTHSMEEADRLADNIAIIAFGKLKCIGNSLRLKTQFGAGYNLNLVCNKEEDTDKVKALVEVNVANPSLISSNAGSLMYSLPKLAEDKLVALLQALEVNTIKEEKEENVLLRDWGLQQTSLEEVFLKVTASSNFGYSGNQQAH